jgi:hypothetical protein
MILSGLLFNFDKLHHVISTKGKVPIVADLMASRWAYEAMAVYNFKNNAFEKPYYDLEKIEAQADFKASFLMDELNTKRKFIADNISNKADSIQTTVNEDLKIIQKNFREERYFKKGLENLNLAKDWSREDFTPELNNAIEEYLEGYKKFYQDAYNAAVAARERKMYDDEHNKGKNVSRLKDQYYNDNLADLVKNVKEKNRLIEYNGQLIQQVNPVFLDPTPSGSMDYRAHFFAPKKNLFGTMIETYNFNLIVIWAMATFFYLTLYFEVFKKLIDSLGKIDLSRKK